MKTIFVEFVSWRWLLVLAVLASLLGLTITAKIGSGTVQVVTGSSEYASTQYQVVPAPPPDAAEIDRHIQHMDGLRFDLSGNSLAPKTVCPPETLCAD